MLVITFCSCTLERAVRNTYCNVQVLVTVLAIGVVLVVIIVLTGLILSLSSSFYVQSLLLTSVGVEGLVVKVVM